MAAALLGGLPSAAPAVEACVMDPADRIWLEQALGQWEISQRDELRLTEPSTPNVHVLDAACTYHLPDGSFEAMTAEPHARGEATLPSVGTLPIGPISFAFAADGFAMSLPSVWRASGVKSELGLERLMTGVLLHEIAHTRQAQMIEHVAEPAALANGLGDELSDDLLQETFADIPGYEAALREETALLFAAAAASDDAGSRALAAHALHMMRLRRAHWLSDENAHFSIFDDVFLTMEGTGQWLIYRYFQSPHGGGHSAEAALEETRRDGKWWSQDEGLALMLVLDRLLPDWRERVFRAHDWLAADLLEAAIAAPDMP